MESYTIIKVKMALLQALLVASRREAFACNFNDGYLHALKFFGWLEIISTKASGENLGFNF